MNFLATNIQALAQANPAAVALLKSGIEDPDVEILTSRNGAPAATLRRPGRAPQALESRYDPARQAAREAALLDADAACRTGRVLILGLGLGYHLEYLLGKYPEANFMVCERRPALARVALSRTDYSAAILQGRLALHTGAETGAAIDTCASAAPAALFRHPALFEADLDYYYPLLRAFEKTSRAQQRRVLSFLARGAALPFSLLDSHDAFRALGHDVAVVDLRRVEREQEMRDAIRRAVFSFAPDFVFTIDTVGMYPELFRDMDVPVVSWFFDNPLGFLASRRLSAETPAFFVEDIGERYYVYTWDRSYVDELLAMKPALVRWLPFAANPAVFKPLELTREQREQFACDVSFAGNSGTHVDDWYRRRAMQMLAGLNVHLYGDEGWRDALAPGARFLGPIGNRTGLPMLYNASAINLNLTAPQLRTALPIRVFDVLAAGGFLLSDHRSDLTALFDEGAEVACFRNLDELREMAGYYMARPETRNVMSAAARRKILECHTFEHRIRVILDDLFDTNVTD